MKLFPNLYIKAKGDRLQVASTGKINRDLLSWLPFPNAEKIKEETSPSWRKLADGTSLVDAENINYEFTGIQVDKSDYDAIEALIKAPVDICMYDEKTCQYVALYACRCSVKKTAESANSVTFVFSALKECTNIDSVTQTKNLNEAYITGIVTDSETSQPIVGATITCTNPAKSGYSVTTDSHGEFAVEVQFSELGAATIHVAKGADTKDVSFSNLKKGSIIEDFEVSL